MGGPAGSPMATTRCPLPLLALTPPYDATSITPLPSAAAGIESLAPGTLLGLKLRDAERDWPALEAWTRPLRRRAPHVPLVLLVPDVPPAEALQLALRSAALAVRAVLVEGVAPAPTLRRTMTEPVDLAADVAEWVALVCDRRIGAADLALTTEILRRAPAHRTLAALLEALGESERAVRKRFRAHGVVAPSAWFALARGLHALLRLQRDPTRALADAAFELGYGDLSTMSRQLHRLFGLRPSVLRHLLGWEWAAWYWVQARRAELGHETPTPRADVPTLRLFPSPSPRLREHRAG